jgi:hypothetical protein
LPLLQIDTIVDKLNVIAQNPISELTTILGVAAPQQATFFITFILLNVGAKVGAAPGDSRPLAARLQAATRHPSTRERLLLRPADPRPAAPPPPRVTQSITFLRVPGLVMFWIFSKLAATNRAKRRLWVNQPMVFGSYTTDHMMASGAPACAWAPGLHAPRAPAPRAACGSCCVQCRPSTRRRRPPCCCSAPLWRRPEGRKCGAAPSSTPRTRRPPHCHPTGRAALTPPRLVPPPPQVILFGLVFCCVTPLIAPVALVYFVVVYTLEKHNLVYVWTHDYEAAGRMYPLLFSQVCVGGAAGWWWWWWWWWWWCRAASGAGAGGRALRYNAPHTPAAAGLALASPSPLACPYRSRSRAPPTHTPIRPADHAGRLLLPAHDAVPAGHQALPLRPARPPHAHHHQHLPLELQPAVPAPLGAAGAARRGRHGQAGRAGGARAHPWRARCRAAPPGPSAPCLLPRQATSCPPRPATCQPPPPPPPLGDPRPTHPTTPPPGRRGGQGQPRRARRAQAGRRRDPLRRGRRGNQGGGAGGRWRAVPVALLQGRQGGGAWLDGWLAGAGELAVAAAGAASAGWTGAGVLGGCRRCIWRLQRPPALLRRRRSGTPHNPARTQRTRSRAQPLPSPPNPAQVDSKVLASLLAEADRCRRRLEGEDVEMGSQWGDEREPEEPSSPHDVTASNARLL